MGLWSVTRPTNTYVMVLFKGHITTAEGEESAKRCTELVGSDSVHLVGDFADFVSYDSGARLAWQSHLWPIRRQIKGVIYQSERTLVRMGVSTFGLFLSITVINVKNSEELQKAIDRLGRASLASHR